ADTGRVFAWQDDGAGGVLITAANGWFWYAPSTGVVMVPGEDFQRLHLQPFRPYANWKPTGIWLDDDGGHGFVLVTGNGLLDVVTRSLSEGLVRVEQREKPENWTPAEYPQEIRFRLDHPCAPVADRMGLWVVAARGSERDPGAKDRAQA